MELSALRTLTATLNAQGVRYLVAGGMAVVAHGYGRMTFDIDLIIELQPANIQKAFSALAEAGYRPRVPISAEAFANPAQRQSWQKEKGMVVLNFWSDQFRDTPVDIFVQEPFPFDEGYRDAMVEALDDGTKIRFVSIPALIRMKKRANRAKDLDDIEHLERLAHEG